jgi:hypothetical protein
MPFSEYCYPLLKFSSENNFEYKYQPWPAAVGGNSRMMDFVLEAWVSSSIERAKAGWMLGAGKRWKPGEKTETIVCGL